MNDFSPWSEKHRPGKTEEVAGQGPAVEKVLDYIKNFDKKKKPLLLYGPPGIGKTCIVQAAAGEFDLELVEMNASDFRTRDAVEEKLGNAVQQKTLLDKKGKLILIDEVDGIHGNSDRGGLPAVYKVIKETNFPIVITANDAYNRKLRTLRKKCSLVKMPKVNIRSGGKRLREIAELEKIEYKDGILKEIARRTDGDMRAAINDLQMLSGDGKLEQTDLGNLQIREKQVKIFDTLLSIFKSKNKDHIKKKVWNSDKNLDEIILWLAENLPKEYEKPEELADAFNALSRADVFKGRIIHNQSWSLLKYTNDLASLGVAFAKEKKYKKFTKYSPPSYLMKMGRSKGKRALRKSAAEEIGEVCHCSRKRAVEQFPYLSIISKKTGYNFGLEEKELEYLRKVN